MITLRINGKVAELSGPTGLLDYLTEKGVNPAVVAVELNGQILDRALWPEKMLDADDVLEIVRMVGGGA
jgi:sulfur carrier protein